MIKKKKKNLSKKSDYLTGKKKLLGTKLCKIKLKDIIPPHDVDLNSCSAIIGSLKRNGWCKRPLLGYYINDKVQAITGSHRIKACCRLKKRTIPVLIISRKTIKKLEKMGFCNNGNPDDMIEFFYWQESIDNSVYNRYTKYIDFDRYQRGI